MLDVLNWARERVQSGRTDVHARLELHGRPYLLATVHRSENTDDPVRLAAILQAFNELDETLIFPVHPRARKMIEASGIRLQSHVRPIDPVGYLDMVALAGGARRILTDSGGLQKEAYWLGVPCLTMRDETEWEETAATGWNRLVGANGAALVVAVRSYVPPIERPALYGDGQAAAKCVDLLDTIPSVEHRYV